MLTALYDTYFIAGVAVTQQMAFKNWIGHGRAYAQTTIQEHKKFKNDAFRLEYHFREQKFRLTVRGGTPYDEFRGGPLSIRQIVEQTSTMRTKVIRRVGR